MEEYVSSQIAKDGRILYIDRIRKCYIMYKSDAVGELIHEFSSMTGEFDWLIKPYWDVIDKHGVMAEIPGIDTVNRKDVYIRLYNPVVVTQRTIPDVPTRAEELNWWLKELHMKEYDLYEFMCRGHARTGNNSMYISRTPDKVIDVSRVFDKQFDIPDFDTDSYGWLEDYINKE